jgi:REP element-mobilizing transposase RayT
MSAATCRIATNRDWSSSSRFGCGIQCRRRDAKNGNKLLAINSRSNAPRSVTPGNASTIGAQSIALREQRIKLEEYLDRGFGECLLRDSHIATLTETVMLHHHSRQFQMLAWVVMPNHVHALIEVWQTPLSRIVQNWKSIVAVEGNKLLERTGRFWQPEYWDRFMRDVEQKLKAIRYIENNPVKAKLCRTPEEWPFSSARFRDPATGELKLPRRWSAEHRSA